jgi:8-oxo-dGTP pyrophosphatase MutT (NUDIX family)
MPQNGSIAARKSEEKPTRPSYRPPVIRPTARVVLLDDQDRLLMLRIHDPAATRGPNPITADFWLLPGGGVRPGETYEQAAHRELAEETGIHDAVIGACVWTQEKLVNGPQGGPVLVAGRYFLARVASGARVSFDAHEPLEASTILGYRWFTRPEILAREATETFLPPGLGTLLGNLHPDPTREPTVLPG